MQIQQKHTLIYVNSLCSAQNPYFSGKRPITKFNKFDFHQSEELPLEPPSPNTLKSHEVLTDFSVHDFFPNYFSSLKIKP